MGVRTDLPCPTLPCPALPCPALPCPALPCPVPAAAQRGTGVRVPWIFLLRLWPYHRSNMEPIDPSHPPAARHVKHHAVYINPEGPQPILSQLTPLPTSCSPDTPVISTASLRSIFTVPTSPNTRSPRPLNTAYHPPPALGTSRTDALDCDRHSPVRDISRCTTTQHVRRRSRDLTREFEELGKVPQQPGTRLADCPVGYRHPSSHESKTHTS